MPDFANFQIKLRGGQDPEVLLDGTPIPQVSGIRVYQDDRLEIPVVALEVRASQVDVVGEGHAAVSLGKGLDEFLGELDPDELQAEVLARGDYGTPPMETAIEVLKE